MVPAECPTCPYGGLDLSAGLFTAFASHDAGVIYGTWWYNDGTNQETTTEAAWSAALLLLPGALCLATRVS